MNRVSVVVRRGNRNYGFALATEVPPSKIQSALDKAYGNENILVCVIQPAK